MKIYRTFSSNDIPWKFAGMTAPDALIAETPTRRCNDENKTVELFAMNVKEKSTNPFKLITKYFLSGLFVLLPLAITIAVLVWLIQLLIRQMGPQTVIGGYLKFFGLQLARDSSLAYLIGCLLVIIAIIVLGFIVDLGARKYVKSSIDLLMKRIPLINRLYNIAVQIVNMFSSREREDFDRMSVVYCFFGGEKGAAFIALMPMQQTFRIKDVDYNVILIPSAPVPVGGSMMLVPSTSILPAQMSIEDFMKIYVSMGAASSEIIPKSLNNTFQSPLHNGNDRTAQS